MTLYQRFKDADFKKKAMLLVVLVLLLVLVGTVVVMVRTQPQETPTDVTPAPQPQQPVQRPISEEPSINPVNLQQERQREVQEADIRIVAQSFVEQFGSYNNQNLTANFNDLVPYMTASLQAWVETQYVAQLEADIPSIDEYYAINTKVLAMETLEVNELEGTAVMQVSTQRQEIGAGGQELAIRYQDARVELTRSESGAWKVNALYWQ